MDNFETRTCLNCGKEFTVSITRLRTSTRQKQFCEECTKELTDYQKKQIRMEKIPGYADKVRADKRASHKRCIITSMLKRAQQRAKKYNMEFNLTAEDIHIPKICPLLEIPIFCGDKDDYENSPSLDRIDNSKGYIKGNVWVISKKANSMKNSASPEELDKFCKNIIRYSLTTIKKEDSELENKESLS